MAQLDGALHHNNEATLTLTDGARESGYSTDHLGRLVREGTIPNAGRPGAPGIASRHFPRKTGAAALWLAPQPARRELFIGQIVQSVIDPGG